MSDQFTLISTRDLQRLQATLERVEKKLNTLEAVAKGPATGEWVGRKAAADVAGVSVRTLDGYVKRGLLQRHTDPKSGWPRFRRVDVVGLFNRKGAGK